MFMNKWARLCFLILGGGTIFKLSSMKDVFYVPMQSDWGLTNTQIGLSFTVYTIVQTTGLFLALYRRPLFQENIITIWSDRRWAMRFIFGDATVIYRLSYLLCRNGVLCRCGLLAGVIESCASARYARRTRAYVWLFRSRTWRGGCYRRFWRSVCFRPVW